MPLEGCPLSEADPRQELPVLRGQELAASPPGAGEQPHPKRKTLRGLDPQLAAAWSRFPPSPMGSAPEQGGHRAVEHGPLRCKQNG